MNDAMWFWYTHWGREVYGSARTGCLWLWFGRAQLVEKGINATRVKGSIPAGESPAKNRATCGIVRCFGLKQLQNVT